MDKSLFFGTRDTHTAIYTRTHSSPSSPVGGELLMGNTRKFNSCYPFQGGTATCTRDGHNSFIFIFHSLEALLLLLHFLFILSEPPSPSHLSSQVPQNHIPHILPGGQAQTRALAEDEQKAPPAGGAITQMPIIANKRIHWD